MKKLFTLFLFTLAMGMWVQAQQTIPFSENFDGMTNCSGSCNATCNLLNGFVNATGDDGNWIVDNGGTSSSSTGPSVDHTQGNSVGRYVYFETSSPCYPNRVANMYSPVMDFSNANAPQLSFWYHMYGSSMGTLHVDVSTDGGSTWTQNVAPSRTDNQDLWQEWIVDLSAYAGDTCIIRWRGISGSSFGSDMAIDDVNFYDLLGNDMGVTSIDQPSTPACNLGDSVWATIFNFGTDSVTSVTLGWSINGTAQTAGSWSGLLYSGEDTSVYVGNGTIAPGDDVCVWTSQPNGMAESGATGAANDTACTFVALGLSGSFTVGGPGADFPSIDSTITALAAAGVCGPTEFVLYDTTYQGQYEFVEVTGASSMNTITYRSASGDPSMCRIEWASFLSSSNYTIFLNGADYFHFEDINIASLGSTYARVLYLNNGANWNGFDGCMIEGMPVTTTSTNSSVIHGDAGSNDNNNHYTNNMIMNGSYSFYLYGSSTTSLEEGTVIENNQIMDYYYMGVRLYYADGPKVNHNMLSTNTPYTGTVYNFYNLYVDNDVEIMNNSVAYGKHGYGIYLSNCDGSPTNRGKVANNMLSVGNPTTTSTSYGIYSTNSGNMDIVHNSVWMSSNSTNSRAYYATSGGATNVWNNIFANDGPGYAVYVASAFSITAMDYNNLYAPNGTLGYFNGAQATLADWQAASGFDANSYSVDPQYASFGDLHVCNDTLDGAAFPLGWPMMDFDGQTRSATPDIGADEFSPASTFSLGADTALCTGQTLMLNSYAGPNDTVLWSTGDTTSSIMVSTPGTYSVTVNGACGTASDDIVVTQSNVTYSGFLMASANSACVGDTIMLSSTMMASSYLWSTGDTTASIMVTTAGTYTLDITDACGTGSESMTVDFNTAPTAAFTHTTSFLTGVFTDGSTATGNVTYAWDFGDGMGTSTLQNPLYVYGASGSYVVSLTVTNECGSSTVTDTVTVISVGIEEELSFGAVNLYPNPSQGSFNLGFDLDGAYDVTYSIVNLQGREVSAGDLGVVNGARVQPMDLTGTAAGVYFVKIVVNDQMVVRKLIIE